MRFVFGARSSRPWLISAALLWGSVLSLPSASAQSDAGVFRSSAEFRGATKVLQILPIAGPLSRQDEGSGATTAAAPVQDVVGERLPGLTIEQDPQWELPPRLDVEPETLPDSRETQVGGTADYTVNWVGLNNRAKPRDRQVGDSGRVGRDRLPSNTLSHVVRRPSPPPVATSTAAAAMNNAHLCALLLAAAAACSAATDAMTAAQASTMPR